MKKKIASIGILTSLFFVLGFMYEFHYPKLKEWVKTQVYLQSYDKLPVLIKFKELDLQPFTLGIELRDITVTPKKDLSQYFSQIDIDKIRVQASLFQLLLGRFKLADISIHKPETSIFIPNTKSTEKSSHSMDTKKLLEKIVSLPVESIHIINGTLYSRIDETEQSIQLKDYNISISAVGKKVYAELDIPTLKIKQKLVKDSLSFFSLKSSLIWQKDNIDIENFKLQRDSSYIVAKANINSDFSIKNLKKSNIVARWKIDLPSLRSWVLTYSRKLNIPKLQGETTGLINIDRNSDTLSEINLDVKQLKIDKYLVGDINIKSHINEKSILFKTIKIQNGMQDILLSESKLMLNDNYNFDTNLNIKQFELKQLLNDISVGNPSLKLIATANLPCTGAFQPKFYMDCEGNAKIKHFDIYSGKLPITEFDNLNLKGKLHLDSKRLSTGADLSMKNSTGRADAIVEFKKGYVVNFSSPNFYFEDLNKLSNLNLKGKTSLKGSTYGNSKKGNFDIQLNATDFSIKDYYLGNISGLVKYDSPYLRVNNILGKIGNTSFQSNVSLNFKKSHIVINGKSPIFNLSHFPKIIEKHLKIPFPITGIGSVNWDIRGPLDISQLNYNGKIQFQRVFINNESIDSLSAEFKAKKNSIDIQNGSIKKASSNSNINGTFYRDGKINFHIITDQLRSEESELLHTYLPNLQSTIKLDSKISGSITKPIFNTNITLDKYKIGNKNYLNGKIHLLLNPNRLELETSLFNNSLSISTSRAPLDSKYILLNSTYKKWDFTPLFYMISEKVEREGYQSVLTGSLKSKINLENFLESNLFMLISELNLSTASYYLENKETMELSYDNQRLISNNFYLKGNDDYFIEVIKGKNNKSINLDGKFNIVLLSFITPFIRDLRGDLDFNSSIEIEARNLRLLGSAKLRDGYAKLEQLPLPFERISADYNFSQNYLQVHRFNTEFGGGTIKGSGTAKFEGYQNLPIKIEAVINNSNLQVNKETSLLSSGNLTLSGNWFPYTLSGDIQIRSGVISEDNNQRKVNIKKSSLLPETVKDKAFTPIHTDLRISLIGKQIKIDHPILKTAINGQLSVQGDIAKPYIKGTLQQVSKGSLLFNETEFSVDTLNIQFPNENRLNPDIFLNANTRWKDYDINLIATGKLDKPQINFVSQPPLNEGDIITLLTLGYTQSSLAEDPSTKASNSKAYELGTAIINNNPLNKELEDRTGITFRFNTATDGADESITVPKVEVSKKWSNKLETKAGRTFGKVLKNDAKIKYKISDKVSVIGSWEGESASESSESVETTNDDIFGLDLEYKIEFR